MVKRHVPASCMAHSREYGFPGWCLASVRGRVIILSFGRDAPCTMAQLAVVALL